MSNINGVFTVNPLMMFEVRISPFMICLPGRQVLSGIKRGCGARSASILPFSFSRQTKYLSCFFRQPLAIGNSIIPAHIQNRMSLFTLGSILAKNSLKPVYVVFCFVFSRMVNKAEETF